MKPCFSLLFIARRILALLLSDAADTNGRGHTSIAAPDPEPEPPDNDELASDDNDSGADYREDDDVVEDVGPSCSCSDTDMLRHWLHHGREDGYARRIIEAHRFVGRCPGERAG